MSNVNYFKKNNTKPPQQDSLPLPVVNKPPEHLGFGLAAWKSLCLQQAFCKQNFTKLPETQLQDLSTQPQALYKPRVTGASPSNDLTCFQW